MGDNFMNKCVGLEDNYLERDKHRSFYFISHKDAMNICINLKDNYLYLERDKYRSVDYISYEDAFKQKFVDNNFACNILLKSI